MTAEQHETSGPTFGAQDKVFRKIEGEFKTADQQTAIKKNFNQRAKELYIRHFQQTPEQVLELRHRYRAPVFGKISIFDAISKLGECIDPTDTELYCTSQLVHCLQVADGMEKGGIRDETLILTALIHDIGKLVEFAGAPPELINCPNEPVGAKNVPGAGLDNTLVTWNHDEFAFQRLQRHVPKHVAWVVRYHSLRFDIAAPFMNESDRSNLDNYGLVFREYDLGTKSIFQVPERRLNDYKYLLQKFFPKKIEI